MQVHIEPNGSAAADADSKTRELHTPEKVVRRRPLAPSTQEQAGAEKAGEAATHQQARGPSMGNVGTESARVTARGSASGLKSCPDCDAAALRALVGGPFYVLMASCGLQHALPTEYDEELDRSGRVSIHSSEGGGMTATVRELEGAIHAERCEVHQLKHLAHVSAVHGSQASMALSTGSGSEASCHGCCSRLLWSGATVLMAVGKRFGALIFTSASILLIVLKLIFPAFDSHNLASGPDVPAAWTIGPRLVFLGPPIAYYWVYFYGRRAVRLLIPLIRSEEAREHVRGRTLRLAVTAKVLLVLAVASWIDDEVRIHQQGEGRSILIAVIDAFLFTDFVAGAIAPILFALLFLETLSWRASFLVRPLELRMSVPVEGRTFENERHYGRKRIRSVASEDHAVAGAVLAGGESLSSPGVVSGSGSGGALSPQPVAEAKELSESTSKMVRIASFTGDYALDEEINAAAAALGTGDEMGDNPRLVGGLHGIPERAAVSVDMANLARVETDGANDVAPVILARLLGALKLRSVLQKASDEISTLMFLLVGIFSVLGVVCTFAAILIYLSEGKNEHVSSNISWGTLEFAVFFLLMSYAGYTTSRTFRVVPRLMNMAADNPTARRIMRANFDITNRAMQMRDRDVFTIKGVDISPAFVLRLAYLYGSFNLVFIQILFGGTLQSSTTAGVGAAAASVTST